jgi:Sulfotransferase domain
MMRAWENRPDSIVVDEPLYAHYLAVTGLEHPGRDEVIAAGELDWRRVVDELLAPVPADTAVFFQKHMTQHLTDDIDRGWIAELTNVLLIRDPFEVVSSYLGSRDRVTAADIGLPQQIRLYDELSAAGSAPLVIDSRDFLGGPETYLRALCSRIGVPFEVSMLAWPPGPRPSDGVWGRYWYSAVWQSTGFAPPGSRQVDLSPESTSVAETCRPLYDRLHAARWLPE